MFINNLRIAMTENGTQTIIPVHWQYLLDKQLFHYLTPHLKYCGTVCFQFQVIYIFIYLFIHLLMAYLQTL
jgi:hypothetical protein